MTKPSRATLLQFAHNTLANPPTRPYIERVSMAGKLVAEFILPLELCEPQNRKTRAAAWVHASKAKRTFEVMAAQLPKPKQPLPGRPQVRCIRFSSVQPDKFNDGCKVAVDRLCCHVPRIVKGKPSHNLKLGLIVDDNPKHADVSQTWEYAPPGKGFVYLAVSTGDEAVNSNRSSCAKRASRVDGVNAAQGCRV